MPESKKRVDKGPLPPVNGASPLEAFLVSVENFVSQISAEAIRATPAEQQLLIQSASDSLVGQTTKFTAFVRQSASRLSSVQTVELNQLLLVQDGVALAGRGVKATTEVLGRGVLGNLLQWIAKHLEELKKILSEILHLIFDLLHIPYPKWLDKILHIIDEIFHLVLSLLSEVFGIGFRTTASLLSEQEVAFLREWAAFEAVRAVGAVANLPKQEEA